MLRVGLTGGMATGKSTVAEMFARRGAHVVQADAIAHQLMSPGKPVYEQVVAHFGREILSADGSIDRKKLASLAFPHRIQELNGLVHPPVVEAQDRWLREIRQRDPKAVAIVEAALIFEAGAEGHFDKIVVVTASLDAKVERFAKRSGITLDEARKEVIRRMAAQIPEAEKARRADYVIDNNGTIEETEAQAERIWAEMMSLARS